MKSAGIDIGSRTIKTVILENGTVIHREVADATSRPAEAAKRRLRKLGDIPVVATGYGRSLLELEGIPSVTEIKACAYGTRFRDPEAQMLVDIGGQDLKTVQLDSKGRVVKFEMNDRCAAGTGKFLEIMAEKLEYDISGFGTAALEGSEGLTISSLCTVFAESEVIGLLNRGALRTDIARAVHRSVVRKITGMCKRLDTSHSMVHLTGGGALNKAVAVLLEKELGVPIIIPEDPQSIVALGAAVIAGQTTDRQPFRAS